jgi:hypothetical protein
MALSASEKAKLNKSMRAAQDVSLGDLVAKIADPFLAGVVTVSDAQANASQVVVETGKTGITGFVVTHYSSGSPNPFVKVVNTGSNLVIGMAPASASTLDLDDVISWMVF